MKVLVVSWEYPPFIHGGLGQHVKELLPALLATDPLLELHVVAPAFEQPDSIDSYGGQLFTGSQFPSPMRIRISRMSHTPIFHWLRLLAALRKPMDRLTCCTSTIGWPVGPRSPSRICITARPWWPRFMQRSGVAIVARSTVTCRWKSIARSRALPPRGSNHCVAAQ